MSEARSIEAQLVVDDGHQRVTEGQKSTILVSNLPDGTNSQMIREIFSKCAVQILYVEIETDSALVHCCWTKELRSIVEEMTELSLQGGTILKLELFEDDEAAKRREVNRKESRIPSSLLIVFGFDTSRVSKSNISEVFSKVARVQKVMIRSKFCFVRFKNIESSTQAMEEYHGKEVLGSIITIEYGMTGVTQSAPEAVPSAGVIMHDTTTNLRKSEFHNSRKLQHRQSQCRKDRELSCTIKNDNSKNSRRRDRSRSRDGRPVTSNTCEVRYRAGRSEVENDIPKFLSTESRFRQRDANYSATSRDRRVSDTVHHSIDLLPQDTYEMADMNGYDVYENVNHENSRTGYEVLQPDPPPECEYDIDYRTRRRRDRENRQNSCDSP